jgi:hypothetical protein
MSARSDAVSAAGSDPELPKTCLPDWGKAELPEPERLSWRHWTRFVGPGIVMMGVQIGGGEWLLGPEITARYGGGLMWIATISIIVQMFYNLECGRYALYCGEPIFTGFLRLKPGPAFWVAVFLMLSMGAVIPGLASHAGAVLAAIGLGRPPMESDRPLVMGLAYVCLVCIVIPVLFGGRIYNTLQTVMSAKIIVVLGFTFAMGVLFVTPANWWNVISGFGKIGTVPAADGHGGETTVNVFAHLWEYGAWPVVSLANITVLGAFAGYAGGGGLANSLYSNFVRDKGWGMGSQVGAIPSAIGGKDVKLSHLGKVFPISDENMRRWRGWWKYIFVDQVFVWAPGCFVGMALPALLSLQFSPYSELYGGHTGKLEWAQAVITADGVRHAPTIGERFGLFFWVITLIVGLMVLLPSQMAVVDEVSRRWTDVIWSANTRVRENFRGGQVKFIYYSILAAYVLWCVTSLFVFTHYGTPKFMTLVIANINNISIGFTALLLLHVNRRLLPRPLRPRWYHQLGLLACAGFYLGIATLLFFEKQLPAIQKWIGV